MSELFSFIDPLRLYILEQRIPLLAPEIAVILALVFSIFTALDRSEVERRKTWGVALGGLSIALICLLYFATSVYDIGFTLSHPGLSALSAQDSDFTVLYGMANVDLFALVLRLAIVIGAILVVLMSRKYVEHSSESVPGEYYVVLLTAVLGGMFLSSAWDLIMIFVALETLGIASYVMGGYLRGDMRSAEASLKYLLYGGASTAVILFGFSLLYAISGGQTALPEIAYTIWSGLGPMMSMQDVGVLSFGYQLVPIMLLLIVAGVAFKLSAAPFHMWTPDVYEGAPTPVTAFLSVVSKTAGFALAIRLFLMVFVGSSMVILPGWEALIITLALLSMTVGNCIALTQNNIKRMLAYSTIAHAGYLLLGLIVMEQATLGSVVFYLLAYLFMNLGAFSMVILFGERTGREDIPAYNGLARKRPMEALFLSFFLLSLAGIPITAGFFAKFYLFQSVIQEAGNAYLWVIGLALINSTISLFYYIRVIRAMVIEEPSSAVETFAESVKDEPKVTSLGTAMSICFVGTVALGFLTGPMMAICTGSAQNLIDQYHFVIQTARVQNATPVGDTAPMVMVQLADEMTEAPAIANSTDSREEVIDIEMEPVQN